MSAKYAQDFHLKYFFSRPKCFDHLNNWEELCFSNFFLFFSFIFQDQLPQIIIEECCVNFHNKVLSFEIQTTLRNFNPKKTALRKNIDFFFDFSFKFERLKRARRLAIASYFNVLKAYKSLI